jgi:hypothetical protein
VTAVLVACAACSEPRRVWSREQLDAIHASDVARERRDAHRIVGDVVACVKSDHDAHAAGLRAEPPVLDILVLSGGADMGAFGAGVLRGWGRATGPLARPRFTVVSGVSTGALLAPFAFLGDEASTALAEDLYRNPPADLFVLRGPFWFLPVSDSLVTVPGLERELRTHLGLVRLARIAEEGRTGRVLLVSTTDLDHGSVHVWDLVDEARAAVALGDPGRVHDIVLASAGIPGVFPHRMIDGGVHVDGAIMGNVLYGGRLREDETPIGRWAAVYPDLPVPKTRYWVIFNGQFRGPSRVTAPEWPSVIARSVDIASRSATATAIRHVFASAEVARLRYGATVEVRVMAIPDEWAPAHEGSFRKDTMNALADLGERMGEDGSGWSTTPPP